MHTKILPSEEAAIIAIIVCFAIIIFSIFHREKD